VLASSKRLEAERLAARKAKCGKDDGRVRVGMRLDRALLCAGPFEQVAEDTRGVVYEAPSGLLRVEAGRVVRWVAR
jgi:hypothetical protein